MPLLGSCYRWLIVLSVLVCSLFAVGCGSAPVPPSDRKQALMLVEKLMSQWKSGVKVEELAQMNPPTFVSEALWKNGSKLAD